MRRILALALVLWGSMIPKAAGGGDVVTVEAIGTSFRPPTVTIAAGQTVVWTNPREESHNVRFEDGQFEMPADPTGAWTVPVQRTFEDIGSYAYYCEAHEVNGMLGTVIVKDPALIPPTTELTKPIAGRTYPESKTGTFRGSATDPSGPITEVEAALRRKKTDGTCGWWNGDSFVAGPCGEKMFVPASGTDVWSLALGTTLKPSKGTNIDYYTLYSRGTDADGNVEDGFERGRNVARFEVKKD